MLILPRMRLCIRLMTIMWHKSKYRSCTSSDHWFENSLACFSCCTLDVSCQYLSPCLQCSVLLHRGKPKKKLLIAQRVVRFMNLPLGSRAVSSCLFERVIQQQGQNIVWLWDPKPPNLCTAGTSDHTKKEHMDLSAVWFLWSSNKDTLLPKPQ